MTFTTANNSGDKFFRNLNSKPFVAVRANEAPCDNPFEPKNFSFF